MREYGKVKSSYWDWSAEHELSDAATLLGAYLMTTRHGNCLGCFKLPSEYVMADLRWTKDKIESAFGDLEAVGFARRDKRIVWLPTWFEHNTIENKNVAKSGTKIIRGLPNSAIVLGMLDVLEAFLPTLSDKVRDDCITEFTSALHGYRNTYGNACGTGSEHLKPEPEARSQKPEPEKEVGGASAPDLETALADWNALATDLKLARVQKLTTSRRTKLAARLRDCGGIEGWRHALNRVRGSPFLRGENERGWKADFDFLLQEQKFTKLMEGAYEHSPGTSRDGRTTLLREILNREAGAGQTGSGGEGCGDTQAGCDGRGEVHPFDAPSRNEGPKSSGDGIAVIEGPGRDGFGLPGAGTG